MQSLLQLSFGTFHVFEVDGIAGCWGDALLTISTDDGSSWQPLNAQLLTDPYDDIRVFGCQ